uniref:BZIP domain-containing protein n=1 Tax=Oryza glaberrima TaxID=4538 RepID=I1QQV0_ORYGL
MEDDEDMWANTSSPSASPPRPRGFISTALSLNSTHLQGLLPSSFVDAAASPCHASGNNNGGGDGRNAAPMSSIFSASASYHQQQHHLPAPAPLDGAILPARRFGLDMCAAAAAPAGVPAAGDRRKRRMIKNRESAARSRARKQARVNNLETEVEQLKQENKMLRVKYEQVIHPWMQLARPSSIPIDRSACCCCCSITDNFASASPPRFDSSRRRRQLRKTVEVPVPVRRTLQRGHSGQWLEKPSLA